MVYFLRTRLTVGLLIEIQIKMTTRGIRPERIIFMSIFNDIDWTKNGYYKKAFFFSKSQTVRDYAKRFQLGHWYFLGPGGVPL